MTQTQLGILIGAILGLLLTKHAIGVVVGAGIGYWLVRHKLPTLMNAVKGGGAAESSGFDGDVYFESLFSIMGYLAKLNGRVSEDEISAAQHVMADLGLSDAEKRSAIKYFTAGKDKKFSYSYYLNRLHRFPWGVAQREQFFRYQIKVAVADKNLQPSIQQAISRLYMALRLPLESVKRIAAEFGVQFQDGRQSGSSHQSNHRQSSHSSSNEPPKMSPYQILGVAQGSSKEEVTKAYRRLLSQYHPDKLISRGASEEELKVAANKTHEIRQAYEKITGH